jgi:tetratricopeptide (TPR) repeat protein
MESAASISAAELEAGLGKTRQALQLYQHALKLGSQLDDPQITASDLYSYGLFLRDSGLSPELAYACLLKSQSLLQNSEASPEFKSIVLAREDLENKLAHRWTKRPRDVDAAVRDALALKLP